ncbi:MAG: ABC transporter ATP-binding protein [Betaproteobacteria bacterium]|nr:ABC transporter ATP-binding protein [Betaproteobacteria bacterium]
MLKASGLSIEVAGRSLIEGLALEVERGQCWALLGRNGTGKTSLLFALAGLRRPHRGVIQIEGRPLADTPRRELALRLGILLQDEPADFWGSTLDYVLLGRFPRSRTAFAPDTDPREQAQRLLVELELAEHLTQPYRTLSGGERQRARIAQLLMQDPDCLLLDEPLQHLDLRHQLTVMQALAARARAGRALLMVLHEPTAAARFCDHALLLYHAGRIPQGPTNELLTQENLESLYQCRIEPVSAPGIQAFIPR